MGTTIRGNAELKRKLAKLKDMKQVVPAVAAASLHVKGKIAKYPRSTEANSPMARAWYQRGWGSKWRVRNGDIHGNQTSEDLGPSWTRKLDREGFSITIGNDTSYGPYVQGDKQTGFHKRHGWKDTDTVVSKEKATVLKFIHKKVDEILQRG